MLVSSFAFPSPRLPIAIGLIVTLSACSPAEPQRGSRGPQTVGFVEVTPTSAPIMLNLNGRVAAFQTSEVRPQVAGVIRKRLFTEGSVVRAGQPLYQIDASQYRAAYDEAQANLRSTQASAEASRVKAERFRPLAKMEAISQQDYTDAVAQARQTAASVGQSQAQLRSAQINLRYTTVPAPISGQTGRSYFTEGALVTANQTAPLTVIQRLDTVYVDIQQSGRELLELRRTLASGGAAPASASVTLKLEDGSDYGIPGSVAFSEIMINESTGTVTLRARFANPQGLLLPGMFVRASFAQAINTRAFLIPQQALTRDAKGNASILLVGRDNRVEERKVVADRTSGENWVVTGGLSGGEKIIVQGLGTLKPKDQIKPVPASAPQILKPPKREDTGLFATWFANWFGEPKPAGGR